MKWRLVHEPMVNMLHIVNAKFTDFEDEEAADNTIGCFSPDERRKVENIIKDHNSVVDELVAGNERLRLRLLSAAGDDLCRLSQEEIKDLSSGKVQIPPKEEFLASCERFHQQIASESGVLTNCLTLAQLIAENERLKKALADSILLQPQRDQLIEKSQETLAKLNEMLPE